MSRIHVALASVTLLAALLASPMSVRAEGEGVPEALRLRNASGEDWSAGRYADAAVKLQKAAGIYRQAEGDYTQDLAVTLRALTWNLVRDARTDEAASAFLELMDLDLDLPDVKQQAFTAYQALYEAATKTEGVDGARSVLDPVREKAIEREYPELAAQVLHDLGSFSRVRGDPEASADYFQEAIAERRRIHDDLGCTWSLNNLANLHLQNGRLEDALKPLEDAWTMIHDTGVVAPQTAVAANVRTALQTIEKASAPSREHEDWLWGVATTSAESRAPEIIPSAWLLLRAARLSADLDPKRAVKAAAKLTKVTLRAQPVEVHAHLAIEAARLALEAGKPRDAEKWLKKLDVGTGPCAGHLLGRMHLAKALAAALRKKKDLFETEADAAVAAWKDLDDRAGYEDALKLLCEHAETLGVDSAASRRSAYEALSRQGTPGGAGSSASGGGDQRGYGALPWTGQVFEILAVDDGIRVHDLVADKETRVAVSWKPKSIGLNGLSLVVFGGWLKVNSLNYAGAAVASGQPGTSTLDALGEIRPIPGKGRLVIRKNGAVSYEE